MWYFISSKFITCLSKEVRVRSMLCPHGTSHYVDLNMALHMVLQNRVLQMQIIIYSEVT